MAFSFLYWTYFLIVGCVMTPIFLVVGLLALPFDPKRFVAHRMTALWAWLLVGTNPFWRIEIEGKDLLKKGQAYVFAANHQSHFDVFTLLLLGHPVKWLAKKSLLFVPFVGQVMALNGYVWVTRSDPESRKRAFEQMRAWLKRGASLFFFPEGTRSADGEIKVFHAGAFRVAKEAGVPVAPVVIEGTRKILPKNSARLMWQGRIYVRVLEPVLAAPDEEVDAFRARVRALMLREYQQLASH